MEKTLRSRDTQYKTIVSLLGHGEDKTKIKSAVFAVGSALVEVNGD